MQGEAKADGRSGGSPKREKSHDSVAFLFARKGGDSNSK